MDELNENNEQSLNELQEELSVTNNLVNVLTEPSSLFEKLSKYPVKTIDWLIPVIIVIIVAILSSYILMSNPEIKADLMDKQISRMEENFQEAVNKGRMTQAQADEQMDKIREQMESAGAGQILISSIGILIFTFVSFFIIAGVFFLLAKFALGGNGDYKSSLLAYGLPQYILVIQIIVMIIAGIVMGKMFMDTSVGSFMNVEKDTLSGVLLHKLDIFSIWFYSVVSIGFAKMFKSESTGKYFLGIFGLWIGFSLLMYFLVKAVPFLKFFGM